MKKSMKIVMEKCFCVLPNSKCDIKAIPLGQVERLAILIAFITILKTQKKNKSYCIGGTKRTELGEVFICSARYSNVIVTRRNPFS